MAMKELSIEEKAQKYNEALERAKGVIEQNPLMEYLKKGIEYIFPELKESEDERIRKALIRFHKSTIDVDGIKGEDILAWLEKQGEQKPAFEMKTPEESLGIDSDTYNKIVDECIYGEQKTAWSEEDEAHIMAIDLAVNRCLGKWHCCGEKCPISEHSPWLKSLKERCNWKPSDEQMKALEHFVRSMGESGYASPYDNNTKLLYSLLEQLKKLKEE